MDNRPMGARLGETLIGDGWEVYSSDEQKVGRVIEAHPDYLVVEKGLIFKKDMYVPTSTVGRTDAANNRVYQNLYKDQLGDMSWDQPPAVGSTTGTTGYAETRGDVGTTDRELHLREEELQASKRQVQAGEVEVGKRVVSEQQTMDVPVTHDEVSIDRHPVDRRAAEGNIGDENANIRVPVMREEVEVSKRPVVTEEVEIHKTPVTEQQRVTEQIRHEEPVINDAGVSAGAGRGEVAGEAGVGTRGPGLSSGPETVHQHRFVDGKCVDCGRPGVGGEV